MVGVGVVHALFHILSWLAAAAPRRALLWSATCAAWLWFHVLPIRRRWTLAHLRAAGHDDPRARWRIARAVYETQARNTFEMLAWRRLLRAEGDPPWVQREGVEHLTRARARSAGRGVLILTAHLGNFDLLACVAARREPVNIISRRLSSRGLNRVWMATRARLGVRVLPVDSPVKPALEALARDEVVALVLDQHAPERRAVEAPFLGLPARTSPALATLALRSGAPIVPCFITRCADGSHRVRFEPAVRVCAAGPLRARLELTTRRCLRVVEQAVRAHPEQWLWLHRRWKGADGVPLITPDAPALTPEAEP